MILTHDTRFSAQSHEARSGRRSHERAVRTHEAAALRAAHEQREQPRLGAMARRTAPAAAFRQSLRVVRGPAYERAGGAALTSNKLRTTVRRRLPMHSRGFVHARHLARVQWQLQEREYRPAVRHWRQLLVARERLLTKLERLERKLAAWAARALASHPLARVYEIDGTWFEQVGNGRQKNLCAR